MGVIKMFEKENLVIGVLTTLEDVDSGLLSALEEAFGPADLVSETLDFRWTSYYDREMGDGIKRRFYSFEQLVDPSELSRIKTLSNEIEEKWAVSGNRKVNLDPGLLDLNRLILATTKNVGHRIPLENGIYGEVTLIFMKKEFHPLPWTYPDYRSPEYMKILKEIRSLYREKLKRLK